MLLSQRAVSVKEHSSLAATFLHTAAWGLDWLAEQHHVTQIWSVLWSNTKTQATSARGLQLTAESRAELTHLNPWNEKMNTLAVWVISSPSHVHYRSRGEFFMYFVPWFHSYSQKGHLSLLLQLTAKTAPSVLQNTALCRSTEAKLSCGCKQYQSFTVKAAGVGLE